MEQLRAQYDAARERERGRLELEIEHWEAELKRRHGGGGLPPTTVSIAGNYNVVQAGIVGSTASIIIDACC